MEDFQNKVALITGAGSGIGRALAMELAESGCSLALLDWNEDSLRETEQILEKKNIAVSSHILDVSDKEKVKDLPNQVLSHHNQIDLVFNNAGLSIVGTVDEVDEDDWNFGLDILLNSVIQMTTVFLPHLEKRPEAAIVNTSSIFGLFSVPKQSIYNVGKFGVKAFTEWQNHQLRFIVYSLDTLGLIFILHLDLKALNQTTQAQQFLEQMRQQKKRQAFSSRKMHPQAQNMLRRPF